MMLLLISKGLKLLVLRCIEDLGHEYLQTAENGVPKINLDIKVCTDKELQIWRGDLK